MHSTVIRKAINGLSGLFLLFFLVTHLMGNLLLFLGPEAYNGYGENLRGMGHGLLLPALEFGLLALFAYHIVSGFTIARRWKHPSRLKVPMMVSGMVLFGFLIWHLYTLRLWPTPDLYQLTISHLKNGWEIGLYLLCFLALGWHLHLGAKSAMRSLGFYSRHQEFAARLVAGTFVGGFTTIVIGANLFL